MRLMQFRTVRAPSTRRVQVRPAPVSPTSRWRCGDQVAVFGECQPKRTTVGIGARRAEPGNEVEYVEVVPDVQRRGDYARPQWPKSRTSGLNQLTYRFSLGIRKPWISGVRHIKRLS